MSCFNSSNMGNCCPPSWGGGCNPPPQNPRYCTRPETFECGETYCCGDFVKCNGKIYVVAKNCPCGCPGSSCDFIQVSMDQEGPTPRNHGGCDCD